MLEKIALQFPNGYKLKCCVRNDQPVGVAAAHVALRSLCIFWAGLCCQLQGPVRDVLGIAELGTPPRGSGTPGGHHHILAGRFPPFPFPSALSGLSNVLQISAM